MLDSITTLAHSMVQSKGVYAFLLGSGVSRTAGIPTGWEVTLDLIREVAAIQGADAGADPEAWLQQNHGQLADYSALLDQLAKTPAQRRAVLSKYIEPTDEQRSEGVKLPTAGHRAIARLVARGYIRVIVTTNFDRLLEIALREAGVEPTVISSDDALLGALPLVHTACTIIKVHGDYLDTRIKNTTPELASYSPQLNKMLDRIFDEYGLIVCGWSAAWDPALTAALRRCPSRRFPIYWALRGAPTAEAHALITDRGAQRITTKGADEFFSELGAKVSALEEYSRPHPLSAELGVAMVKRYVLDPSARIKLHDLVEDSLEDAIARVPRETLTGDCYTPTDLVKRSQIYEAANSALLPMLAAGARWSTDDGADHWAQVPSRLLSQFEVPGGGAVAALNLRRYNALLAWYAVGLGAVAGRRVHLLRTLLGGAWDHDGKVHPVVGILSPYLVMESGIQQSLPSHHSGHYTPLSRHLASYLGSTLPRDVVVPGFEDTFDTFEILAGMVYLDIKAPGALPAVEDVHVGIRPARYLWRRDVLVRLMSQLADRPTEAWWMSTLPFDAKRALALLSLMKDYGERHHPW